MRQPVVGSPEVMQVTCFKGSALVSCFDRGLPVSFPQGAVGPPREGYIMPKFGGKPEGVLKGSLLAASKLIENIMFVVDSSHTLGFFALSSS